MDQQKQNEEKLREACCYGDNDALAALIAKGTNVNCKHDINGWTGLHWACKRGNVSTVRWLLANGADQNIENNQSQTPAQLTTNSQILNLLGVECPPEDETSSSSDSLPITPNYLKHPAVDHKVPLDVKTPIDTPVVNGVHEEEHKAQQVSQSPFAVPNTSQPATSVMSVATCKEHKPQQVSQSPFVVPNTSQPATSIMSLACKEMVLKVRTAYSSDPDFIEVEFQPSNMSYGDLLITCCKELAINPQMVERIRKLPNTRLRNDKDVKRLTNYAELELVIKGQSRPVPPQSDLHGHAQSPSTSKNTYQSISNFKNQTILY